MDSFNAKCLKITKQENGEWLETFEKIHNSEEMIALVGDGVEQVNISKYIKLYYSLEGIEKWNGIQSTYKNDSITEYMGSPLLLVECDDNVPIDITKETIDTIKANLVLF